MKLRKNLKSRLGFFDSVCGNTIPEAARVSDARPSHTQKRGRAVALGRGVVVFIFRLNMFLFTVEMCMGMGKTGMPWVS